ncbi:siderophore ABC transporter substrate-binding protein [Parapedobacter koreensis]|uniref:Iron complex transport system substrate-binding protein n=1 Tax=Parapedobacter koreensis TaxID=332977 RepID=A0A1H7EXD7_9SPHI|nr:ABC transporter substrate-binding protein [Parapedobacter koreensis]SEK18489.1 iron complex transport system substrate-binding protein [Parapedobacter koreensis]
MQRNTFIQKVAGIMLAAFISMSSLGMADGRDELVTIKHRLGETQVKKNPQRVVVFDIGSLETYHELGIPVVGVTNSVPAYLAEYKSDKYAKLGGIKGPDIQAITAFAPDLIIISGRQSSAYDSLSAIAPTIFLGVDTENYWSSFETNVRHIAKIHGKEALAEQKLAALRQKRDLVTAKTKDDDHTGFVILHVRGGHTSYGSGSRFGFIHDVLGVRQSLTDLDDATHTGHRFKEGDGLVKKANPDYLFLIDRDSAVGGEEKQTDELLSVELKQTPAYRNKKVVTLPGNIWYVSGGGLISVDKKITDVGEQLYGLTF